MYRHKHMETQSTSSISGLIISFDRKQDVHLMYCDRFSSFVRIDRSVEEISPARWLRLQVRDPYFNNQFPLNYNNCLGFDDFDVDPPSAFAYRRYFPLLADLSVGEILVSISVTVVANYAEKRFCYDCFEINPMHFIDPTDILRKNDLRDGQKFIVELQASLSGWIVLRVHENDKNTLFCDKLPDSVVPYNISYLDETNIASILSRTDVTKRKKLENLSNDSKNLITKQVSSNSESMPSKHEPMKMPRKSEQMKDENTGRIQRLEPIKYTKSNQTLRIKSEQMEDENTSRIQRLEPIKYKKSNETLPRKSEQIEDENTSRIQRLEPIQYKKSNQTLPRKSEQMEDNNTGEILRANTYNKSRITQFLLDDPEELKITSGTQGLFSMSNSKSMNDAIGIEPCKEKVMENERVAVLCIIVHRFKSAFILFAMRRGISNVLLLPDCEGIKNELQIGDVAYFEVSKRRVGVRDSLISHIPYSHIAVRMKSMTPVRMGKIELFKKRIRSFGNLLEVKVEIDLQKRGVVEPFYDDVSLDKKESDRQFYILTSELGIQVIIPCARLQAYLDGKLTADFCLQCWAIRRKPIGNVSMHIGETTEACIVYKSGKVEVLPPVSNYVYEVNV